MISNSTSGNILKASRNTKSKQNSHKKIHTITFIAALFPTAKAWKQLKCPLMDKGIVIHMLTNIIQTLKMRKFTICNNIVRPWRPYTKWIKSDWKRHHMISFICGMKNKNKTNSQKKRSDLQLPEAEGKLGKVVKVTNFQLLDK